MTVSMEPIATATENDAASIRGRSPLRLGAEHFIRHLRAVLGLVLTAFMPFSAAFAPLLTSYDPNKPNLKAKLEPPSVEFPRGTDHFGRDVLARMLYGARVSLLVGLGVVVI